MSKSKLQIAQEQAEEAIKETNQLIDELGHHTLTLYDRLTAIQTLFDRIRNVPSEKRFEYEQLREIRLNWKNQAEKIESDHKKAVVKNAGKGVAGVGVGIAAAALGPTAAMGIATTFGVASTGTAISALSGAAATNAALAWLGGGALAAGGGGMAAGNVFLTMFGPVGWTIATIALLGSGLVLWKSSADKSRLEKVFTLISKRDVNRYRLAQVELNERIARIDDESEKLADAIEKIVTFGIDYNQMTEAQQYELGAYVNLMNASTQLLVNPIAGLLPQYTYSDLEAFMSSDSTVLQCVDSDEKKNLLVALAQLLFRIELDETDKRLLWKSFRGNKSFIHSFNLEKKALPADFLDLVSSVLARKYEEDCNSDDAGIGSDKMSKIYIVKKGITDFTADCIVNAANEGLREGGGVCGAIFRAAGSHELTLACQKIGGCPTGSAVITPAFNLKAKYIIHAVGPMYVDGKHNEPSLLYDCYKKSLELAKEYHCHSIVFPLISAGIFGYPADGAWRKAIRACTNFIVKNPEYKIEISFAVLNDHMVALGEKTLREILVESDGGIDASKTKVQHKSHATAEDRVKVFQDTQNWIGSDPDLAAAVTAAKKKTTIYYEDDYPAFDMANIKPQRVTVSMDRSYEAAMRIAREDPKAKIAVMNFANAFHPGGGVVKGASAQEESLCRCSTLYPLLYRRSLRSAFYKYHEDRNSPKASDTMMYTEGVVICKTDTDFPERMPKEDWTTVDVMTIAAPDLRQKSNKYAALVDGGTYMNNAELFGYHVKRALHMLTVAASKKADVLVLGAFGCGAFENDPEVVARAYKIALQEFPKVFERVEFAVYCSPKDTTNYDVFCRVLTDNGG